MNKTILWEVSGAVKAIEGASRRFVFIDQQSIWAKIPISWKRTAARLAKLPFLNFLMVVAVRLAVPRHRIGVMLVALDDEARVLLFRHVFHPHTPWGLPGGWLNQGESPSEGVLREFKEETGLTAVLSSPLLIENQSRPPHIGIAYLGRIQPGPMTLSAEIIEAQWFPTNDLPVPLSSFTKDAIGAARQHVSRSASQQRS